MSRVGILATVIVIIIVMKYETAYESSVMVHPAKACITD